MEPQANAFTEEAFELLTELESSLLELEKSSDDADLIARIFRAMHTIKGSGAMFGFDEVASFTHDIETVYDLLRNNKIVAGKDLIRKIVEGREDIDRETVNELTAAFKEFLPSAEGDAPGKSKEAPQTVEAEIKPEENRSMVY